MMRAGFKYLLCAVAITFSALAALVGLLFWGMQPRLIDRFEFDPNRSITITLRPEFEPLQPYYFTVWSGDNPVMASTLLGCWNPGDSPKFELVRANDLVGIVLRGRPTTRSHPASPRMPAVLVGAFDFRNAQGDGSFSSTWSEKRVDYERRLGLVEPPSQ